MTVVQFAEYSFHLSTPQRKTTNDIFKANNGINAVNKSLFESNLQIDNTNTLKNTDFKFEFK